MWAASTVLTTRVYMNLVWLAKKPVTEQSSNLIPVLGGIRMHVTTFMEVQTDDWKPRARDAIASMDDGLGQRRF